MNDVWVVVFTGIIIVFSALLALILIFTIFGKLMAKSGHKKEKKAPKVSAASSNPAPVASKPAVQAPPAVQAGISGEVVAAITAAISAYEGAGTSFVIRSIRKQQTSCGRPAWARAGLAENTRPF